jgi:CRP/FNR family transcriptional regulator, cyclic AMP receptor protein
VIAPEPPVRLLQREPDLTRYLSPEQRAEARTTLFPVDRVAPGDFDVHELFDDTRSFGALLLDGMLVQRLRLNGQVGVRVVGPGDLMAVTHLARSELLTESICRAVLPTRLALLGYDMLAATHRWPMLVAGLHSRTAEQSERLVAQLMICQLPRVDDRVLSILWLLAETWGQVSTRGTSLPLTLTHELIGQLIGARRPTVSLALRDLTDGGALLKQDAGWLLLKKPPSSDRVARLDEPQFLPGSGATWTDGALAPAPPAETVRPTIDLQAFTARFGPRREEHLARVATVSSRLAKIRVSREENRERRLRIRAELTSRSVP